MKKIFFLICLLFQLQHSFGQNSYGEILPPNFEETTTYTIKNDVVISNLPKSIDLSKQMPPAGNQNPRGVCWAFASTYAVISHLSNTNKQDNYFYLNDGRPDYSKIKSPELPVQLYFQGTSNCDSGATSSELMKKTLQEYGSISLSELPFSYICNQPITTLIKNKAKQNARFNYDVEIIRNTDLITMKSVLSNSQPLLLSIAVDDNFANIPNNVNGEYKPYWKDYGFCHDPCGHAMTIVGYNDSIGAVKVLNSWGTGWGNQGYLWISYKILNNNARYFCYPILRTEFSAITPSNEENSQQLTTTNDVQLSTWFKSGYYRQFNNFRIGLAHLDTKSKFAMIDIRDDNGELLMNFYIDLKTSKEFHIKGVKYSLTFDNIGNAGWFIIKKAMFFSIKKV